MSIKTAIIGHSSPEIHVFKFFSASDFLKYSGSMASMESI